MSILERLIEVPVAAWIFFALGAVMAVYGWYQDKHRVPGNPSLIPPVLIMLTGFVFLFVASAELFSTLTGVTWTPPSRNR